MGICEPSFVCIELRSNSNIGKECAARLGTLGTKRGAQQALIKLQGALLSELVAKEESKPWIRLLLREHIDPSPAYNIVYEGSGRAIIELIASLIGRITDEAATEDAARVKAFALFGQILIFRITQSAMLRLLDWKTVGAREIELIESNLLKLPTG
jgi:TetR/AcrR family transcriptional regulator, regulator of cefoperazone and chloramphenicol sensitivity